MKTFVFLISLLVITLLTTSIVGSPVLSSCTHVFNLSSGRCYKSSSIQTYISNNFCFITSNHLFASFSSSSFILAPSFTECGIFNLKKDLTGSFSSLHLAQSGVYSWIIDNDNDNYDDGDKKIPHYLSNLIFGSLDSVSTIEFIIDYVYSNTTQLPTIEMMTGKLILKSKGK